MARIRAGVIHTGNETKTRRRASRHDKQQSGRDFSNQQARSNAKREEAGGYVPLAPEQRRFFCNAHSTDNERGGGLPAMVVRPALAVPELPLSGDERSSPVFGHLRVMACVSELVSFSFF